MRARYYRLLILLPLIAICAASAPARAQHAPADAEGFGIGDLMHALQQVKSVSGRFVERKFMQVLDRPLVASGMLHYTAPDRLQKVTVSPKRERLTLDGDTLTIEGGPDDADRTISLARYPEVGAFVEGIRATLAGDLAQLRRFYEVSLSGDAADWELRLVPKDPDLRKLVLAIRIAGSGNSIGRVVTEEAGGDHSEMSIVDDAR